MIFERARVFLAIVYISSVASINWSNAMMMMFREWIKNLWTSMHVLVENIQTKGNFPFWLLFYHVEYFQEHFELFVLPNRCAFCHERWRQTDKHSLNSWILFQWPSYWSINIECHTNIAKIYKRHQIPSPCNYRFLNL